jgi:fructose-1,6-bisphosphatase/inositol monophosphatase family enzyme
LKSNNDVREKVLENVKFVFPNYTENELMTIMEKKKVGNKERIWVLDPIDG